MSTVEKVAVDQQEVGPRKARPVLWWALVGASSLAFAAYLIIRWLAKGEADRVDAGPTPMSDWMDICLQVQQWGLITIAAILIVKLCFVNRRRDGGRMPIEGLMILGFGVLWWSDPLYNYFQHGFNYNTSFVNYGSWISGVPGWQSPNGDRIAQPIIWLPGIYMVAFLTMVYVASWLMRKAQDRWPRMGVFGILMSAFVPMTVIGTFWEAMFMRMGSHHYGNSIPSLTLFHGEYYQFPVYQGISASVLYTSWGALRFFRDDRGRSFVEKGLERVSTAPRNVGLIRYFAVLGYLTVIFFAFYHIPMNFFALKSAEWPADIQSRSYLVNELCGEGTDYACPGEHTPIFREHAVHLDTQNRLVLPEGEELPHYTPFDR